jgi:heavy metal efflux system protein
LQIAVPLSLALIGLLLWLNFSSLSDTLLALPVIPMAIVGGILALFVTGLAFSVSAAIGFIAQFGISVMDGILIISQYHRLIDRGLDRIGAVVRAGELQMRPVLMTCVIAGVGLVAGCTIDGNRLASAETACGGRGRWHDARTPSHPDCSSRVDHTCRAA